MKKSICSKCRQIKPTGEGCDKPYCLRGGKFKSNNKDAWYQLSIKEARRLGFRTNWKGNPNISLDKRQGYRAEQLRRCPYCEECKKEGIDKDVTGKGKGHVDHIIPFRSGSTLEEQMRLFEDPNNHRSLCVQHHMSKTGSTTRA